MLHKAYTILFLLLFIFIEVARASDHEPKADLALKKKTIQLEENESRGVNIKLMPAFFWNTLGLEFEFPISKKLSIGLNLMGKLGRTDGKNTALKVKEEDFLKDGYLAELALKYYLSAKAPVGAYIQLNFTYSNILYFDGNYRPYTLHNHWKQHNDLRTETELINPIPYSAGIGVGYQVIFIPDHIIGNLMIGAQGHMDQESNPLISIYLNPSLGFKF